MKPIIRVENLSKQYKIGAAPQKPYLTLRESLADAVRAPFKSFRRNGESGSNSFWALKNISFEVKPGEVVGIIGRNGAGKSTLLKILSRITEPSRGKIELYGRVGSLLEVGTGFHHELTGRENIFLNGAILGMKREEIAQKFDEIVDFAEVEKFLDTAVKHYSSGMYMRLAFAVAANLDPEILIVDEVLAVGDSEFQKKCLGKMKDISQNLGRTVLFVSHNMVAVESLCNKAVLLEKGQIIQSGDATPVINEYLSLEKINLRHEWRTPAEAPGNSNIKLKSVEIIPFEKEAAKFEGFEISIEEPLTVKVETWNLKPVKNVYVAVHLFTDRGVLAFATPSPIIETTGEVSGFLCTIPPNLLNAKVYSVQVVLLQDNNTVYVSDQLVTFEAIERKRETEWFGEWEGVIRPKLEWTVS